MRGRLQRDRSEAIMGTTSLTTMPARSAADWRLMPI